MIVVIQEVRFVDITILVPCCDQEVTITARDILRGVLHRKETNDKVLVGCPNCSTALAMDQQMPTDTPLFEKWVKDNSEDENWLPCVPFLDERIGAEPNGSDVVGGKTLYRSGEGGPLMTRSAYMVQFGIDPEKALAKNPSMGGKPKNLG